MALGVVHQTGAAGVAKIDRNGAVTGQDGRDETGNLQDVARRRVGFRIAYGQFAVLAVFQIGAPP